MPPLVFTWISGHEGGGDWGRSGSPLTLPYDDYNLVWATFTLVPEPDTGDFDGNGIVDGQDFLMWQTRPEYRFTYHLGGELRQSRRSGRCKTVGGARATHLDPAGAILASDDVPLPHGENRTRQVVLVFANLRRSAHPR